VVPLPAFRRSEGILNQKDPNDDKGVGDLFQAGPKMTVPLDIKAKLYEVESNTEAAQGRKVRVISFAGLAAVGFLLLIGNTAISTIAEQSGGVLGSEFDWAYSIPFLSSKWGGIVDIMTAGLFGTLVELEYRTRDENVERIWQEMKRREQESEEAAKKKIRNLSVSTSKGGMSKGKGQKKRLAALAELTEKPKSTAETQTEPVGIVEESNTKQEGGGIFGAAKRFYKQADEMAAAQALLLNKKLEEEGLVEKITDETGLRVVGRDAAKKLSGEEKKEKTSE